MLPPIDFAKSSLDDEEEGVRKGKGATAKDIVDEFVDQAMEEIWRTKSAREKYLKEELLQARAKRAFSNVVKRYKADWEESKSGEAQFNFSMYLDNVRSGYRSRLANNKFNLIANDGQYLTDQETRVLRLRFTSEGASDKTMPLAEIARRLGKIEKGGKRVTPSRRDVEKILNEALEKIQLWRDAYPPLIEHPDLDEE